jgi:peptide/nickel transport system permease protein
MARQDELRWLLAYGRAWAGPVARDLAQPRPLLGMALLAGCALAALITSWWPPDLIGDVDPGRAGLTPSTGHWFGTDHLGRDIALRLVTATRAFVAPGLLAAGCATLLGVVLGCASGLQTGWRATALRYPLTVLSSLPVLVLALLVASIVGGGLTTLALSVGVSYAPLVGEAVRARVRALAGVGSVPVLHHHGLQRWRVVWVHTLWGGCGRLVLRHALDVFGAFLIVETTLSYLGGFGVSEPDPSWGNMLAFSWGRTTDNPAAILAPAVALWTALLATTWVADGVGGPDHGG